MTTGAARCRESFADRRARLLADAAHRGYLIVPHLAATPARGVIQAHAAWCAQQRRPCVKRVSQRGAGDTLTLDMFTTGYAVAFGARPAVDARFIDEIARACAVSADEIDGAGRVIQASLGPVSVIYGVTSPDTADRLAQKLCEIGARWHAAYRPAAQSTLKF